MELIIWTQIEAGIYLISACLPTYRPLLERIGHRRFLDRLTYTKTANEYNSTNVKEGSHDIPLKFRSRAQSGAQSGEGKSGTLSAREFVGD